MSLSRLIFFAGIGQLSVLMASALVPLQLDWRRELRVLPNLLRQMYWVYGGYVVLAIVAFGAMSAFNSKELAGRTPLARGMCAYIAVFWGVRLLLQAVFDANTYLTRWWLRAGYMLLTMLFAAFTVIYTLAAL